MTVIRRPLWLPLFGSLLMLFVVVHTLAQAAPAGQSAAPPPVPYLVKDINPNTLSSFPESFVNWNGKLYFSLWPGVQPDMLWASDGTPQGTLPVPPHVGVGSIFATDEKLFFTNGYGLWAGDGTGTGSELVANLGSVQTRSGLAIADTLFLVTLDPTSCNKHGSCLWYLWVSDGTPKGTQVILSEHSFDGPKGLVDFEGRLYFLNNGDSSHPSGLYTSDGTPTGTVLVAGPYRAGESLISTGELMFFSQASALWKSDGTSAGTSEVVPQTIMANPQYLTNVDGMLYFFATDSEGNRGLWRSDGTPTGTAEVIEVTPCVSWQSYELGITAVGGISFFCVVDSVTGEELWRSDGTTVGTYRVKDIRPGSTGSFPKALTHFDGGLFFWADDGLHGDELWRSDGTEAGTMLVKDINDGTGSSSLHTYPEWAILAVDNHLFFSVFDGRHGYELWRSDGTEAGTILLKDINTFGESADPYGLFTYQDKLYFGADGGSYTNTLWVSDGTAAGTIQLLPASILIGPQRFTQSSSGFYFVATNETAGQELWYSDGTPEGTSMEDIHPTGSSYLNDLIIVNSSLFFRATDGVHGFELWFKEDPVTNATLIDIFPGSESGYPEQFATVSDTLLFSAQDGINGSELWRSDGTVTGTVMVKDIFPGSESGHPEQLTNVGDAIFFTAQDGIHSSGLWHSDGTVTGTVMVKGFEQAFSYLDHLSNVGGTLFFFLHYGQNVELWKSDGTESGTAFVADNFYSKYGVYRHIVQGDTFYFVVYICLPDGCEGQGQLWKSDGTDAGTILLRTFPNSLPENLTNFNETLYFLVEDTLWQSDGSSAGTAEFFVHPDGAWLGGLTAVNDKLFFTDGARPWQSDGTAVGTLPLPNVFSPYNFTGVGDIVFFVSNDGRHGTELWAINPNRHFFMLPMLQSKLTQVATLTLRSP